MSILPAVLAGSSVIRLVITGICLGYVVYLMVRSRERIGRITVMAAWLIMAVLTNIVSNAAAAGIGTPIALSVAQQIGAPTEPFFLAVLFGANMSFATPIGYQTNLLVMSAGGYKFTDFLRVGIPLTLIMWAVFSIILPLMYGL